MPPAAQGEPLLGGPALASTYHLRGAADASPYAYGRDSNPSWTGLERALSELNGGGESVAFASGMAAVSAVLFTQLAAGDVLVAAGDGYPGVRGLAERLGSLGVESRLVATDTPALLDAIPGARLVWVETPSNPRLDVCDIAAVAEAAHAAGALLAVDNTLATPLGQQPLELGADIAAMSATKTLAGHSDVLLGAVTVRDKGLAEGLRRWRSTAGAIPGAFDAWLVHRSLATLELRLERSSAGALAVARALRERADVLEVLHPDDHPVAARQMRHFGCLVGFTLECAERAQAVLDACELVTEATSFGGVHATAERRARWSTDAVAEGFIRYSAGCEDPEDLVADLEAALDDAAPGPA